MSTSPDKGAIAFIREMRTLGAVRVCVGDVEVEFPGATQDDEPADMAAPIDPEAKKKQAEALLYGSSD